MAKFDRNIKFSLRKLAVGLASVGIGYFVAAGGAYAADNNATEVNSVAPAESSETGNSVVEKNQSAVVSIKNATEENAATVENKDAGETTTTAGISTTVEEIAKENAAEEKSAELFTQDHVAMNDASQDRAATSSKETIEEKNLDNKTPQSADKLTVETSDALEKDKNYYEASKFDANKVLEVTDVSTTSSQNIDLTNDLDKIRALDSATIYLEFKAKEGQNGTYSLFSASSATNSKSYYAVGVNGSTPFVGAPNQGAQLYGGELKAGTIDGTSWNSLAVSINRTNAEGAGRIDVYLNGQYLFHSSRAGKFLKDFTDLTNMQLGRMNNGGNNIWGADVDYRNFTIYNKALTAAEVAQRSKNFNKLPNDVVNEDGKVLTEGKVVLNRAEYSPTAGFRIPTLLKTADGTLIAGADRRIATTGDWGDIEMMVRLSKDNGKTWSDKVSIFNLRNSPAIGGSTQPASMDMALVQDPATGKVFAFYDLFPEGRGMSSLPATPVKAYEVVDGKNYQLLYRNEDGAKFTIREDGAVYDANNQKTEYRVVLDPAKGANNDYDTYGDIYDSKGRLGNIYFSTKSTFTVPYTSYIMMSESSDNGQTWSAPKNISNMVRTDEMEFQGIGPGTAIVLKEGEHVGRIVVPIYTRGSVNKLESARVMYSDDHGVTWKSGEAANDGRIIKNGSSINAKDFTDGSYQNSEAAVVELKNGQLKMFMRNRSGKVQIATSNDGGATWENNIESTNIPEMTTQMSAISTIQDGKEYIILVNGGTPRRLNGYARVAEVNSDGSLTWKEDHLIQKGQFAYNSIQQISATEFGLLYEHDEPVAGNMYYKTMNWNFLKPDENKKDPTVVANISKLTNQSDVVALSYNQSVVASDNLVLKLSNGKTLPLVAQYDATTLLFKWDKDADQGATIVGVEAGTLDSLQNYKLDISASLPYTLEPKEVTENIAFDTYYKGDEKLAYGESREEAGKAGLKKITTTYSLDKNGKVVEKVVTTVVTEPVSHVIVKGTKPTIVETKTDLPVEYVADNNLAYGQTSEVAGSAKVVATTTTYEVDATTGNITPTTTTATKDNGQATVIKVGTKPKVVTSEVAFGTTYEADNNLDLNKTEVKVEGVKGTDTTTTTYKLDGNKAVVDKVSTVRTTEPTTEVIKVGTKPKVVTSEVAFGTTYEADETLAYGQTSEVAGVVGTKETTTTYKLENGKAVVDATSERITVAPKNKVVKVGTKPKVATSEVAFGTTYEADNNLDLNKTEVKVEGVKGTDTTTTTYKLENGKAVEDKTTTERTTQPKTQIIKVGTKPKVVISEVAFGTTYEADDTLDLNTTKVKTAGVKGTDTTTTTYKLENGKAIEGKTTTERTTQPKTQIIKVGTKPKRVESEIASPVRYQADANLEYGKTTTIEGRKGLSVVTTTYEVNSATGEVTSHVGEAVVEKAATETVVKVGNVKVEKAEIAPQTTYVADSNLAYNEQKIENEGAAGEQTTTSTYKVDASGNLVDPTKTTTTTKDVVNKVVKVGNVTTATTPIAIVTTYVDDNENFVASEIVEVEGSEGESKTTTTYAINAQTGALENPTSTTTTTKEMQNRIIKRGTRAVVAATEENLPTVVENSHEVIVEENYKTTYIADENLAYGTTSIEVEGQNGRKATTINEATLNGEVIAQNQVVTEDTPVRNAVVKVGTRPTRVESEISSPVRYEADETLEYGKTTTTEGQKGLSVVTTTYEVNSATGEVTSHLGEAVVEKATTETVVKVGTKPSISTANVDYTRTYEADDTLDLNTTKVKTAGVKGVDTTTTTYKLDGNKAVVGKVSTVRTTEPTTEVVSVGTKPTVETSEVAFGTDYVADSNLDYGRTEVRTNGTKGVDTTTTTYKLDGNKAVVDKVSTVRTTEPITEVVAVGTKPTVETSEVAFGTDYVADETLAYGQTSEVAGVVGTKETTTTYKLENGKAVVDTTSEKVTTQPKNKVVKVGTKATTTAAEVNFETTYEADDTLDLNTTKVKTAGAKGTDTTTTTYKLDGNKAVVDKVSTVRTTEPTAEVILVGTKPTVETSEVAFGTDYVADETLEYGQTSEVAGTVGTKETTTTYKLENGKAVVDTTSEKITTQPKNKVVKIGNVKVEKAEIAPQTTYVADSNLAYNEQKIENEGAKGEQTITSTYKVDASGNLVDPAVTTATTKDVVNKVVKVGNIEKSTNEIAIETVERVDSELEVGKTSETSGQVGESTTTTTYEVNAQTGALENPKSETTVTKEMERKVIHIGTKVSEKDVADLNNVVEEAKKQIEASNLSQEEKAKQLAIIENTTAKDKLVTTVGNKEISVVLDNAKLGAEKLVVVESEKEAEVKDLVTKELPSNTTVVDTYDIHLVDQDNNIINKNGETRLLTVAVTKDEDENLEVYYVNGSTLEKMPSIYEDGKLSFFTNHFSTYTIVKTKTPQPDPQPQPDPENPDKPKPQPENPDQPQPDSGDDKPKPDSEKPDQQNNGKDAADKDKNSESNNGKNSDGNKVDENNFHGNNEKITKEKLPNTSASSDATAAGIIALVGAAVAARRNKK